ncbi:EutN/CcmL family microcompartment protein [Vibrio sp. S9_S30]|uniref:EutN/CcmL family microcompartment protein n=1 Tax=Vibrio sp. S9_S30 TaxID=2720226 RepID=UPI0016819B62|nr:EutN/CcmL family microcompartment protein [Vibrio sp. S9_S30]MBD1558155.1 EutN/CcmL family microcompartment protein [Vibrio sp. S9_S30]
MLKGRVIGHIWSTKRIDALPSGALLEVELDGGNHMIAYDPLGCGKGESVLIAQGSVATEYFQQNQAIVDAIIIGTIDNDNMA